MISQIMLKISYGGILNYFTLKEDLSFNGLIQAIINRFRIHEADTNLIDLCDEDGYIFCENSFDYFTKLFPASERIFYVKINYDKIQEDTIKNNNLSTIDETMEEETLHGGDMETKICFKRKQNFSAPVIRQNCFIGEIPNLKLKKNSDGINNCLNISKYELNKGQRMPSLKKPKRLRI